MKAYTREYGAGELIAIRLVVTHFNLNCATIKMSVFLLVKEINVLQRKELGQ